MTASPAARDGARMARDGAVNYGGALVAALVGLALVPLLLDRLGAEHYGVLLIALTCANLVTFLDVGLGSALTREVALASADRVRFVHSAGTGLVVVGLAGAAVMACVGAFAGGLGLGSADAHPLLVFALVGVGFAGDQLTVFHSAVLGGLRRFGAVNALLVGSVVVRAVAIVVVLSAGGGVVAVAALYAVSAWVWAAINALWLRRLSPELALRRMALDRPVLRARLGFGAGSLVIMFALTSLWSAGPLLVAGVEGAAASALFAVSQRFALALQAVPERVSATLFPAAGPADVEHARWLIASGTRLVLAILAPLAAILLVAPGDVLHAWLGRSLRTGRRCCGRRRSRSWRTGSRRARFRCCGPRARAPPRRDLGVARAGIVAAARRRCSRARGRPRTPSPYDHWCARACCGRRRGSWAARSARCSPRPGAASGRPARCAPRLAGRGLLAARRD